MTLRPVLLITRRFLVSASAILSGATPKPAEAEFEGNPCSLMGLVPCEKPLLVFGKLGKDLIRSEWSPLDLALAMALMPGDCAVSLSILEIMDCSFCFAF